MCFSRNGQYFLVASSVGTVEIRSLPSFQTSHTFHVRGTRAPLPLPWRVAGQRQTCGPRRRTTVSAKSSAWTPSSGEATPAGAPAVTSDGRRYIATGGGDAMVCLWDVNDLVCARTYSRLECVAAVRRAAAFCPSCGLTEHCLVTARPEQKARPAARIQPQRAVPGGVERRGDNRRHCQHLLRRASSSAWLTARAGGRGVQCARVHCGPQDKRSPLSR
jgi:WD40 repeat protein